MHKRELSSLYPEVEVHVRKFDAADEESVKNVVQEALDKHGRLDIMFANAGIFSVKLFYDASGEEFMKMMRMNTLR